MRDSAPSTSPCTGTKSTGQKRRRVNLALRGLTMSDTEMGPLLGKYQITPNHPVIHMTEQNFTSRPDPAIGLHLDRFITSKLPSHSPQGNRCQCCRVTCSAKCTAPDGSRYTAQKSIRGNQCFMST